ncbi:MAG: toprim domain-containing protein [Cellulosilyticum sp.]|nr:toprim domain-containing protein [Cellulosilyticum sp.]
MITREQIGEIKNGLSPDQIRIKIAQDLGLKEKNKKYQCFMHNDTNPSMSFDEKSKRYHCFACGGNYDIFDHYMQSKNVGFYDACKAIVEDFSLNIEMPRKIKKKPQSTTPIDHGSIASNGLDYLQSRGIGLETIRNIGIKQDNGNLVFVYRNAEGEHIANKYRPASEIPKGKLKTWFQKSTNQNTLFNMDKVNSDKPLVICEGEIDCMSLIEAGYKNSVSVPTGCQSEEWIDVNWEWLGQFDEIIIWFDNDDAGKKGVRNVANRLPNARVKIVETNIANDVNEILCTYGKQMVLESLKTAKEIEVEGVIRMSNIEDFNVYEAEKIKSGIALLDKHIQGFVMGSLVIITGYNGCGKSTLANQMIICESVAQGYKVFAFSGELTAANFRYWLYTTIANKEDMIECKSKEGTTYLKIKDHAKQQITDWIDNKLFLYDKYDYSEDSILKVMELLAKRKGVRVFLLDNLMKVSLATTHNELLAQKNFINALKQFAVKYNAIVHLCCHPRKPQAGQAMLNKFEISGTGDITNLADYIVGIHRVSDAEKKEYLKYQDVIQHGGKWNKEELLEPRDAKLFLFKDRPTGVADKEAALYFDNQMKRFYITEKDLYKDYGYRPTYIQEEIQGMRVNKWLYEM